MPKYKGFDFVYFVALFLVFLLVFMAKLETSWSSSSTRAARSFEHVSLFGAVEIPEKAAFSDVKRVNPFESSTISNCDINVLKTGWFDIVDHDSEPDPFFGIFNNVRDMRQDINSVTITYAVVGGEPLDVTSTPIKKFESVLGAPFTCDDFFAESGLEREGDEGCWAKTFSAALNLAPGDYQIQTQFFYSGDIILDNTITVHVEACNG